MIAEHALVLDFCDIGLKDTPQVGGKNASLGHLYNILRPMSIPVADGFCTTSYAFRQFLAEGNLTDDLQKILSTVRPDDVESLERAGAEARAAVMSRPLPMDLQSAILRAHASLCKRLGRRPPLAVRSSATAEDLPTASFAGQHESFMNVEGDDELLHAVHQCFASLFTNRAIDYRTRQGFDQLAVYLSVGIQPMVRSDLASAGVAFTLDPETGFRNAIVITGSYGLGEMVVKGMVDPDEWIVFKPALDKAPLPIVGRRCGRKDLRLVFSDSGTQTERVGIAEQALFCLTDVEVLQVAKAAKIIEDSYSQAAGHSTPMDIEWAKDGETGEIFILQARPETVHSAEKTKEFEIYRIKAEHKEPIVTGQAVGTKIGAGKVRIINDVAELAEVQQGDVLVTSATDPDWEPVMKKVAALVTDQGGRTAHAAIVSRELGLPCVVGTGDGTQHLMTGQEVTVSCAEGVIGKVYGEKLPFTRELVHPDSLPETRTRIMLNVGDPGKAFGYADLPSDGVGLARMEFIIVTAIGIHPMALVRYPNLKDKKAVDQIAKKIGQEDPKSYFITRLSEGIGKIAAAFYPNSVIVRTSDFKTNEYARLLGGAEFEPEEENAMLGFRGASRYYSEAYAEGFALECAALKRTREQLGLTNVKVMVPFCRTVEEGKSVIREMAKHGLIQGEGGLEIYAMCEIPSNALLAKEFLSVFNGFSIGSNDLTQLTLGVDRDSDRLASLFNERDPAVKELIARAIHAGNELNKPVGICGQAPSDYPDFAAWLVEEGITSVSVNPDAIIQTIQAVSEAEERLSSSASLSSKRRSGAFTE